jgi:beta-galactosidase
MPFHRRADWENPAVLEINREVSHSPWRAFESVEQALRGERTASSNVRVLDGRWSFKWVSSPQAVPRGFWECDFQDEDWASIQVPGCWETQGFGEPIYTNIAYPFKPGEDARAFVSPSARDPQAGTALARYNPPHVPAANPTGCYRRFFSLPPHWHDRRVYVASTGWNRRCICG